MPVFRPLVLALIATLAGCNACNDQAAEQPAAERMTVQERVNKKVGRNIGGDPQLVLFVVMDTVRSDHTSLCGYDRPTTPRLAAMARAGAAFSCDVYAPAPWTLPSHASFFTGRSVTEHATMFVGDSDVEINSTITARPLDTSFKTLAETYADRGYQTVAISANSIVNDASGLLQGFQHRDISTNGLTMRMRGLGSTLRTRLEALDPDKPVFMFINIYDAHDPYPQVPDDLDWIPGQPRTPLDAYTHDPDNPYYAFIKGIMTDEEKPKFLERLTNGYDYGVLMADTNLSVVMTILMREGWLEDGYRMLVTSDHGEFLGEHNKLRHCGYIWEPVVRVPLVYFDTTKRRQPVLPKPMSGMHVYDLLLDGKLPETLQVPHTVSEKNPTDIIVGQIAGAVWGPDEKAVCMEGEKGIYKLTEDPDEESLHPIHGHPLEPELDRLCSAIDALHELEPPKASPELTEALKAMGYLADDE
jgi:hypothetical protein